VRKQLMWERAEERCEQLQEIRDSICGETMTMTYEAQQQIVA